MYLEISQYCYGLKSLRFPQAASLRFKFGGIILFAFIPTKRL